MYLSPTDIACYVYCPIAKEKNKTSLVNPPLNFFESNLREAFILAEQSACIKDNIVNSKRLHSAWDKVWWPAAAGKNMDMKEANKKSLSASRKFADYCKYDISDWFFPTAGVNTESDVVLGASVLKASVDIIKVDLNSERKNTVLVNFTNRELSIYEAAQDPIVKATAYAFHSGRDEIITHVLVNINEKNSDVRMVTSTFRPEDMYNIRRMLEHTERGISSKLFYANPYQCKGCKSCRVFI